MSKQSRAGCHHPLSWIRRVSSELWSQKVQGPQPQEPFYGPAGRAIHSLISSDVSLAGEWLVPEKSESVLRIILPRTTSTKLCLGCGLTR
ncbi:hypothetical protein AVEN_59138-1 [Araneus ventricosus]|uniref:Uncharacterized protein n=1 Tax=Araneus ventricosus TaxID=182803 RepID=A0A4Y2IGK8_ARAVE|nr:hypothetical protein AVEN_59138-1 [Araneus ventricosus]